MIRRLAPEDAELLRRLRLSALADAPTAFGSTYGEAVAHPDARWPALLRADGDPTFVWEDGRGAVAMVVGTRDRSGGDSVWLVAMWVHPSARGEGVADALVEQVLAWAIECGAPAVRLSVTDGNTGAERLYARHGFPRTGRSEVRARDGRVEIEMEAILDGRPRQDPIRPASAVCSTHPIP